MLVVLKVPRTQTKKVLIAMLEGKFRCKRETA